MTRIKVLIADDHALLRQGIRNVLDLEPGIMVVGEAADGEDVIAKTARLKPDVILLDLNMPNGNGIEVTRRIKRDYPHIHIIILTIHDDENYVFEVVKAGAAGYLLKDIEPNMLTKAIKVVYNGETFIYPTLTKKLVNEFSRLSHVVAEKGTAYFRGRGERLSYREIEILQLIAQGMSNSAIASKLYLSEKTVKNHLTNIFRKIGVNDRTQAAVYAIKHKLAIIE